MRYWILMFAGLLLAGVSVVLFDWGLFHLVRTPSCGSSSTSSFSGPPCPPGTGAHILALIGGIFGGLTGIGLFAARGRKGSASGSIGLGLIMWCLLFVTAAGSIAYSAYGPGNRHSTGAKTTAIVLGVIFLPLGLGALPLAIGTRRKTRQFVQFSTGGFPTSIVPSYTTPYVRPPATPTPAPAPTAEDPLEKIAKLGQLRDRGLVTPEEFEKEKKRLLGEI
jgi:hypothetical protein